MSKTYHIPVVWTMCDTLEITADSYKEACEKAQDMDLTPGEYVETSFEIDEGSVEVFYPEYLEELNNEKMKIKTNDQVVLTLTKTSNDLQNKYKNAILRINELELELTKHLEEKEVLRSKLMNMRQMEVDSIIKLSMFGETNNLEEFGNEFVKLLLHFFHITPKTSEKINEHI